MDPRPEIARALAENRGVITTRSHPQLTRSARWLVARGELVRVLPGTYLDPDTAADPRMRMRAVIARYPDAVIIRAAAAKLTFWPDLVVTDIEAAQRAPIAPQRGYRFVRRSIPPELIVERAGLRFSDPALTAIDLATLDCADAIDIALRTRATTLSRMYEALRLTADRAGNRERRRVLLDSRDEPWSAAERDLHRLLRAAGIRGWKANLPVIVRGRLYYLDVGFRSLRVLIEVDGRIHRLDASLFESDRRRQNALTLDGWLVLRFTWLRIQVDPEGVIAEICEALTRRRRARSGGN